MISSSLNLKRANSNLETEWCDDVTIELKWEGRK